MIEHLVLNDSVLDPGLVLAQATVLHGRQGFGEQARPMSATVTIEHPAGSMPPWQSGDTLSLHHFGGQTLFTGRIVQRSLAHRDLPDGTRVGQLTVTAAGPLAALNGRKVGDEPWPQESGSWRAQRILEAAHVVYVIDGDADLMVLPRDVDAQPAGGLLDDLAADTSAAVFDDPYGQIVYQALSGRSRPLVAFMWSDFTDAATWDEFDPALTWDGDPPSIGQWPSPTSRYPVVLPPAAVEWEPEWSTSEATVINHVRVGYGTADPQEVVDLVDDASVERHGERYLHMGSQLASATDASARATHILSTQNRERWEIGDVHVALDHLDPATYAQVIGLQCGDAVTLQGMPQPAPAIDWTGIVEGWTFTQYADGGVFTERLTLALSDPLHSLQVMTWDDYPTSYLWSQHPAHITWDDLDDVDILEAA